MIDLLNLEKTKINRSLRDKYLLIYGSPKVGKTTFAAQAGALILGFEKGINAIPGAYFVDINRWADVRNVLRQLEKDDIKEKFETVAIDTVGLMYDMCETYICGQYGVEGIGEIPYGQGWGLVENEFQKTLLRITKMGYGLILISHADIRLEQIGENKTMEVVSPLLSKRAYKVCNQLVDIIGYIGVTFDNEGNSKRHLYTRRTPQIMAGSRFPHLPAKIPFGYVELRDALYDAIEKSGEDSEILDEPPINKDSLEKMSLEEALDRAAYLWNELITKQTDDEVKIRNHTKATKIIEDIFGEAKKLSDTTEDERELLIRVIEELQELL